MNELFGNIRKMNYTSLLWRQKIRFLEKNRSKKIVYLE